MSTTRESEREPLRRTLLGRLRGFVLPEVPDFYRLLIEQCEVTTAGTGRLLQFLGNESGSAGGDVLALEHEGDRLKHRSIETLHRAFSTPIDREDFYEAIVSIDEILNYAKTTVRECEVLGVTPDAHMQAMAEHIHTGTEALLDGFRHLAANPELADQQAERARKSERATEKAYRQALAALFDPDLQRLNLEAGAADGSAAAYARANLELMTGIFKHREIYRHLSNAADHVAHAGQLLGDIVTKST